MHVLLDFIQIDTEDQQDMTRQLLSLSSSLTAPEKYQYLCVVNLSRRQTLIKIFTKYLLGANSNIQHTTQHGPTYNTGVIRDSWKVIFEKFSQSWKRPLLGPSTAFTSNLLILPGIYSICTSPYIHISHHIHMQRLVYISNIVYIVPLCR